MKQHLYDITSEISAILGQEEWTDETEQQLEGLNLSLEGKAQNILGFCAELESFASAAKAEEQRIAARRKAAENRVSALKSYLKSNLEAIDRTELAAGTFKIAIQNNPPSVIIDDESAIPPRFWTIIPETKQLDKKAIAEALKKGENDIAAHLERGTRLVVK